MYWKHKSIISAGGRVPHVWSLDLTITHVRLLGGTTHFLISSSLAAAGGSPATSWSLVSSPQPSPAQPSPAHTAHTTTRRRGSALEFALSLLFTYVGRFFPRFSSNSWTRASLMANSWMDFCLFTESFHSRPGSGRSLATGALWRAGGWARGHDSARMVPVLVLILAMEPSLCWLAVCGGCCCVQRTGATLYVSSRPPRPAPPPSIEQ